LDAGLSRYGSLGSQGTAADEQLAMDLGSAPQPVLKTHSSDEIAHLFADLRSAPERTGFPSPVMAIVTRVLVDLREKLAPFYSDIRRPSIDPELMIRMLIVGYCYGIRFERKLCEEGKLHLGYRWFCRLELDDKVPDHSTFSVNRHG
jgi:hypothetical protein